MTRLCDPESGRSVERRPGSGRGSHPAAFAPRGAASRRGGQARSRISPRHPPTLVSRSRQARGLLAVRRPRPARRARTCATLAGGGDAAGSGDGATAASITGRLNRVRRVLHHRLYGLPEQRLERVHAQFQALATARAWRCEPPWVASSYSRGLFDMEFFRHLKLEDVVNTSAAGFVKMAGDETDALIVAIFMRDLSAEYGIKTTLKDEDHPLAKLRPLEFHHGRLPNGQSLDEILP